MNKRATRWVERVFVAEGIELLRVALNAGAAIESVYVAPEGATDNDVTELCEQALAKGIRVFDLAPGVIEKIADTVTPQPVMTVLPMLDVGLDTLAREGLIVVLVDVRDPGNAGTILRTADAAGATAIVACGGTVDLYNPKTVRSSAGSIFNLPVVVGADAADVLSQLGTLGFTRIGTVVRGGEDYLDVNWTVPTALVVGNESSGLGAPTVALLDATVGIHMEGQAESLNVGVATAGNCL